MAPKIGICVHRDELPATIASRARQAEELGYDEFWLIEDCFFTAGTPLAASALTATAEIGVGVGIMPTVARNPAVTAMEIGTLAELGEGRFHAGLGHGVQDWMAQMGERRPSPLTMLDETFEAVQALLAGDEVSMDGTYVYLDKVKLEIPPAVKPPVSAGVRGPRSLEVAARRADGVILADFCSPAYLRSVLDTMEKAAPERAPRVTVFSSAAVGDDGGAMREIMSYHLADVAAESPASLQHAPFFGELQANAAQHGWLAATQAMPADWWGQIAAVGTPGEAASYLERMADAGADVVALFPSPFEPAEDTAHLAEALLPLVS